jgi:hypothetical protein
MSVSGNVNVCFWKRIFFKFCSVFVFTIKQRCSLTVSPLKINILGHWASSKLWKLLFGRLSVVWYDMIYDMIWYMIWYDKVWYMIWYTCIFNRSWVDTRWQQYITHLHTNSSLHIIQRKGNNTEKGKLGSAGRAPSLRIINLTEYLNLQQHRWEKLKSHVKFTFYYIIMCHCKKYNF